MLDGVIEQVEEVVCEYPVATAVVAVVGYVGYKYIQQRLIIKGVEKAITEVAKQQKKKQKKNKKAKIETEE